MKYLYSLPLMLSIFRGAAMFCDAVDAEEPLPRAGAGGGGAAGGGTGDGAVGAIAKVAAAAGLAEVVVVGQQDKAGRSWRVLGYRMRSRRCWLGR